MLMAYSISGCFLRSQPAQTAIFQPEIGLFVDSLHCNRRPLALVKANRLLGLGGAKCNLCLLQNGANLFGYRAPLGSNQFVCRFSSCSLHSDAILARAS